MSGTTCSNMGENKGNGCYIKRLQIVPFGCGLNAKAEKLMSETFAKRVWEDWHVCVHNYTYPNFQQVLRSPDSDCGVVVNHSKHRRTRSARDCAATWICAGSWVFLTLQTRPANLIPAKGDSNRLPENMAAWSSTSTSGHKHCETVALELC